MTAEAGYLDSDGSWIAPHTETHIPAELSAEMIQVLLSFYQGVEILQRYATYFPESTNEQDLLFECEMEMMCSWLESRVKS